MRTQIIRFQHRTESAAYFIRQSMEMPWDEILKTQLLALKRQVKLSFGSNALQWAVRQLTEGFKPEKKF